VPRRDAELLGERVQGEDRATLTGQSCLAQYFQSRLPRLRTPWHFFSDVPVRTQPAIAFTKSAVLEHGEPTVKYRGISLEVLLRPAPQGRMFVIDENASVFDRRLSMLQDGRFGECNSWAQEYFKRQPWEAAFQTDFYEKWFEMMLRLKANYHWPASECSGPLWADW
jgi:hypothetical protein